jgi:hypothetical protein
MSCEHVSLCQNVEISTTAEYESKIENGLRCADSEKSRKVSVRVKLIHGAFKKKVGGRRKKKTASRSP